MTRRRAGYSGLIRLIAAELAPYPDRLAGSLRDTLGVLIALVVAMTLRVPGFPLALALLYLTQRERPGLTVRSGFQIVAGAASAFALSVAYVQVTDAGEAARFLGVVLGIFAAAFCMSATTIPLFFTIFGFYWFLDLAAWDAHHTAWQTVTSGLNNLASITLVMLSAAAVEYTFRTRHPAEDLVLEMQKRVTALCRFFTLQAQPITTGSSTSLRTLHYTLVNYAHAGDLRMQQLYDRIHDSSPDLALVPIGMQYRIGLIARVLEKAALLGFSRDIPPAERPFYAALASQCDCMQTNEHPASPLPASAPAHLQSIDAELRQYNASIQAPRDSVILPVTKRRPRMTLFLPGVFQQPDKAFYALKLTLAATICYLFYNAVAWPGIVTCVVTVLFTGLSSTGAMKQKQLYRFAGAAIGGALGIIAVSLFFPNMDSITSLVLVVGIVSLLSAWVLRSPRMSYVGVQIGFAFFLTALPGFSAATALAPARDRIMGVAIGILVMWFIFDLIWPLRTSDALASALHRIREACHHLQQAAQKNDSSALASTLLRLRVEVSRELATLQGFESAVHFDVGRSHQRELASTRRLIRKIESAAGVFYAEALRLSESR